MKEPAVVCKENNMADASGKGSAKPRNRQWTETELKYFALVLLTSPEELFEIQIVTRARLMCAWARVYAHTSEIGSGAYYKIVTCQSNKLRGAGMACRMPGCAGMAQW